MVSICCLLAARQDPDRCDTRHRSSLAGTAPGDQGRKSLEPGGHGWPYLMYEGI